MATYFEPAIKRICPDAKEVTENYDKREVRFCVVDGKEKVQLEISKIVKALQDLLGTVDIFLNLRGDGRYASQGMSQVIANVEAQNVTTFPDRPQ
jgi:hypothetical protein